MPTIAEKAAKNAAAIVNQAIKHDPARKAMIVFDRRSALSRIITDAYRAALPNVPAIDFDAATPEEIIAALGTLVAGDLAIMIQSGSFMLAAFRFRIELFQRSIAVIEHVHLERIVLEDQMETYVDALQYDSAYYHERGATLSAAINGASVIKVRCVGGTELTYEGGMEPAKLNIGDYAGMKNVGGTFPIGEVFSEPRELAKVNGEAMLYGFAGTDHLMRLVPPFKIRVEKGVLASHEGPAAFQEVMDQISLDEQILVREFGLGLNRAMGKHRLVSDITAFERQLGLHFSLGEKHGVYKKPGFNPKKTRYHIDVFVDVERIEVDGRPIYADGDFLSGAVATK